MLINAVTLKNQHTIPLKSLNLVIGPNNSGKSSFLVDLQKLENTGLLLESVSPIGLTEHQIKDYLDSKGNYSISAPKGGIWRKDNWEDASQVIKNNFTHVSGTLLREKWTTSTTILDGKTRLSIVDDKPYNGIDADDPQNVFTTLRKDRELQAQLQKHLEVVLPNKYFVLWTSRLAQLRAYICDEKPPDNIEYLDSPEAAQFFAQKAQPLANYSDGIKAYLGILINVIADGKQQFLIDEPEAFLHPNLCFKLGQTLASIASDTENMCFCATHSPYFLKGCLSQNPNDVSVTRFEFENDVSKANTLETDDLVSVIHDPLLNNIGVTEGLFHARVVVTEGDSDRAFYTEINNRLIAAKKGGIRDCIFINAQNKQTIAKVLKLFRKVSIPCAAISDIDILKEGRTNFSNLLTSLSIPQATAKSISSLRKDVDQSLRDAAQADDSKEVTFEGLSNEMENAQTEGKPAREFLATLRGKTKPPDYKKLGGLRLLKGDALLDAEYLVNQLKDTGWFVLKYGEVEDWLMSLDIGKGKSGWLLRVFGKMGSDPMSKDYLQPPNELDDAWLFIDSIREWFVSEGRTP